VLLFIDNIFRFTQAGSEVSALLGRMPSAVGYQPTLATEMGELQERITSTKNGSVTSVQAIYVPADDLTDPAPATAFAHLDATTVSSEHSELGIYPAVDPLDSTSRILEPDIVGKRALRSRPRRAGDPAEIQGAAGHHRDPGHGRAVRGGPAQFFTGEIEALTFQAHDGEWTILKDHAPMITVLRPGVVSIKQEGAWKRPSTPRAIWRSATAA
jgi:hypothetical protein